MFTHTYVLAEVLSGLCAQTRRQATGSRGGLQSFIINLLMYLSIRYLLSLLLLLLLLVVVVVVVV